jgi:hypothetical protein
VQLADAGQDRARRRDDAVPHEPVVQRDRVDRRVDPAAGEQRGERGGEPQRAAALGEVERFLAQPVAPEQRAPARRVDEAEREHPLQALDEAVAPLAPCLEQHLGVARREEAVALADQLLAQLRVVVDDPVEHAGEPEVRVDHRLRAARREVDDRQATVRERDRAVRPGPGTVGPPLGELARHAPGGRDVGRAVPPELSGEAAHGGEA